jgi:signal transduction histidine kinase/ActR/RegA family two-component response regulator
MDSARISFVARGASLGSNLSIFSKGLLLVAIPVLLQLAVLAVLRDFQASAIDAERWAIQSKGIIAKADGVRRLVAEAVANQRGGVGDQGASGGQIAGDAQAATGNGPAPGEIIRHIDALSALVKESPAQLERVERVRELATRLEAWLAEQRRLIAAGREAAAFARGGKGEAQSLLARIDEEMTVFLAEEDHLDRVRSERLRRANQRAIMTTSLAALASVPVAALMLWIFTRSISSRLHVVTGNAARLAGRAPLAPPLDGSDEIAQLDRVIHRTAIALGGAEERERLLESERAARAESERASRLKDEFLATLSHELRTPLNAILGWAQLLRARARDPKEIAQGLQTIERNARAQAQIVEDLLEMSRIISGKLRLDVQRIDLRPVIDTAVQSVKPAAEAKNIQLLTTVDHHTQSIAGDPARLQQILWNLLSNAIKFTPRDGRVEVALRTVESHVEVTVSDTGQGIRREFLPFLFDRFRQADASTTRQHRGMGLGLSIVKSLVEMHGGTIAAHSDGEGQGAMFTITLPLSPVPREDRHDDLEDRRATTFMLTPALEVPRLGGVRVLVVDDEPDARDLLKRILSEFEADVETVSSASEALPLVERVHPDVLVSDIGMPEVDGYELIRAVRLLPADDGGQTPALALTAFARSEDRQRALLAGYQAHMAKPIEPSELITTIASLAGRIGASPLHSSSQSPTTPRR